MLVQEVPLVLSKPEHPRLEQYVVDNPGVVVVGLDWVTEFQVPQECEARGLYTSLYHPKGQTLFFNFFMLKCFIGS